MEERRAQVFSSLKSAWWTGTQVKSKNMQPPASKCLGVFHISSAAKQANRRNAAELGLLPEHVSNGQPDREEEICETDDLTAPHGLLPVIHKASLTPPPPPTPSPFTHTHELTGSRADILGGVIPGVDSLRSPCCDPVILGRGRVLEACRERKRRSIKNTFRPEAVSLRLYSYK